MKKIPLERIRERARERPEGYYHDVVSRGEVNGETLFIEDGPWRELVEKYNSGWMAGLKEAVENAGDNYKRNRAICEKCDEWRAEAWFGYGGCAQCGCSALKLLTPGQACPLNKWSNAN